MTSSGLEIPADQNPFHMASILDSSSPVIITCCFSLGLRLVYRFDRACKIGKGRIARVVRKHRLYQPW